MRPAPPRPKPEVKMTHQEVTERITALARAMSALSAAPQKLSGENPVQQAINSVASELELLTNEPKLKVPPPPKAPTPPESRTIVENGKPQD